MTWHGVALAVVVVVLGYGFGYFVWLQAAGLWLTREERRAPAGGAPGDLTFYLLVPCLDEELVIADTVRNLLAFGGDSRVAVIDDGSTDATSARAREAGGDAVLIIRRDLPDARTGKGEALNHAFAGVVADAAARGLDPDRVIVGVMDADGRLSPGTAGHVAGLFDDPRTGGAQLQVRIRNRQRVGTRMQDVGFWGTAAVAQMGRNLTGSVSLGGNGQFARLSALTSVGRRPWSRSLTEDLDLAVSLLVRGWRTRMTSFAWVEQEGPEDLRALIRQRTRWAQGHMVCAGRAWEVWRARRTTTGTAVELVAYLLQPWCLALPWSILSPLLLLRAGHTVGDATIGAGPGVGLAILLAFYVLAFFPFMYTAGIYHQRAEDTGFWRAYWLQYTNALAGLVTYVATWRALFRIVRGRTGWDKTRRAGDVPAGPGEQDPTSTGGSGGLAERG